MEETCENTVKKSLDLEEGKFQLLLDSNGFPYFKDNIKAVVCQCSSEA